MRHGVGAQRVADAGNLNAQLVANIVKEVRTARREAPPNTDHPLPAADDSLICRVEDVPDTEISTFSVS